MGYRVSAYSWGVGLEAGAARRPSPVWRTLVHTVVLINTISWLEGLLCTHVGGGISIAVSRISRGGREREREIENA